MPSKEESAPKDEVLLYQTDDGKTHIDVRLQGETVWLTQTQMTELFQTTKQNVSLHLKNVFDEGELVKDSVVKESLTTASDGKSTIQPIIKTKKMRWLRAVIGRHLTR